MENAYNPLQNYPNKYKHCQGWVSPKIQSLLHRTKEIDSQLSEHSASYSLSAVQRRPIRKQCDPHRQSHHRLRLIGQVGQ